MKRALAIACLLCMGASDPRLAIGIDEHVGAAIPRELTLVDSTGRAVALGSYFTGKPVVLVLAYARCTMLCSVVLRGMAEAVRRTGVEDYTPIVVSLDPRETPDEAARRQNKLLVDIGHPGDRNAWPYLVGDEATIAALADTLGFRYAWDADTKQYAHPAVVFVITADGRIAEYVRGVTFDGLRDAVARARDDILTTSTLRDVLACFHFQPALRRYGSQITMMYRLGAGLVLFTLLALIASLVVWERRRPR